MMMWRKNRMAKKLLGYGQATITDMTDSLQIITYITADNQRQVLFDPNTNTYTPDLGVKPMTLSPEVFLTGKGNEDQSDRMQHVKWSVRTSEDDSFVEIGGGNSNYELVGNKLLIKSNIFKNVTSALFRLDYDIEEQGETTHATADIELVLVSLGKHGEDSVILNVTLPDGDAIRNHEGVLVARAELYKGSQKVEPSNGYKWFTLVDSKWNQLTGIGGVKEFTSEDIHSLSVFKVEVSYEGQTYEHTFMLRDITDPYQANIIGATTFRNGQGTVTLTSKVYQGGEEVDLEGREFLYDWYAYTVSGKVIEGFHKTGKTITVDREEVDNIVNIQCEIRER